MSIPALTIDPKGDVMKDQTIHRSFLLILALSISLVFMTMIRSFLMAILLAGIFSALAHPFYRRINSATGGRKALASAITLLIVILVVLLPLTGLLGVVTAQAKAMGDDRPANVGVELTFCGSETVLLTRVTSLDQAIDFYINKDSAQADFLNTWVEP